jgi:hypothetical protein
MYRLPGDVRIGLTAKNFIGFATHDRYKTFALPYYLSLGISKTGIDYTLSLDSEYIFGTFGGLVEKDAEMWFLRGGFEKEITPWATGRVGIIYPAIAKTSTIGDIRDDMPSPKVGGSIGIGLNYKPFTIDFSIYGDPVESYLEQDPRISSVVSITMNL